MSNWEQIVQANQSIHTTDIKGKEYAEVNQRIKAFRMVYPDGGIVTELLNLENGICVMRATAKTATGEILGTGTAYEKENSTYINKTSYIENCETSAVGRALGMCGFGIDTSIASYEEVTNAINNQDDEPPVIPVKITEQQIANLEAVFAAQPDGGKALRIIVLGDKNIKELTNVEYGNILNQVQKIGTEKAWVKKNVDRYVKAYAGKVKKSYEDCYRELEEVLNVKFEEQTKESIVPILKRIEELANGGY